LNVSTTSRAKHCPRKQRTREDKQCSARLGVHVVPLRWFVRICPCGGAGQERVETLWSLAARQQGMFAKKTQSLATFARTLMAIANNDQSRQQIVQTNIVDGGVHRTTFPSARLRETFPVPPAIARNVFSPSVLRLGSCAPAAA